MCKLQYKAFNELPASDRQIIANEFKRKGKIDGQKVVRLPAIGSVWLLVPEGKTAKQIIKAQRMIKNFGMPKRIISTEVPLSFLESVA